MARNEYYVDPLNGNDTTGDGSSGNPWKTVKKVIDSGTLGTEGVRCNLKDTADDVITTTISTVSPLNPTEGAPLIIQGCTSAAGDGGIGGMSGNGANAIMYHTAAVDNVTFIDMRLHNCGSATAIVGGDQNMRFYNCHFENCSGTYAIWMKAGRPIVQNCRFDNMSPTICMESQTTQTTTIVGNYIEGTFSTACIVATNEDGICEDNIIVQKSAAGHGIDWRDWGVCCRNNTLLKTVSSNANLDGIKFSGTAGSHFACSENIIEGWNGTGNNGINFSLATQYPFTITDNLIFNCTTLITTAYPAFLQRSNSNPGATVLKKDGALSYANRLNYFAPVGAALGTGRFGRSKGAVQGPLVTSARSGANIDLKTLYIPRYHGSSTTIGMSTFTIDADGEAVALIGDAPKTGSIEGIGFLTATLTASGDLDARIETVNPTDAFPSGTLKGTNGNKLVTVSASNTWYDATFTSPVAVTQGDRIAVMVKRQTGSSVNTQVRGYNTPYGGPSLPHPYPYIAANTGTWATSAGSGGVFAIKYTDGYVLMEGCFPFSETNNRAFASNSTPDERGNIFQLPMFVRAWGAWLWGNFPGDMDIVLYDFDGTTALLTKSLDKDNRHTGNPAMMTVTFPGTVILRPNVDYRLVCKPTSTTSVNVEEFSVNAAPIMNGWPLGGNCFLTTRTDGGAWTNTPTQRMMIGLIADGIQKANYPAAAMARY